MKKRAMKKWIPYGLYCYDENGVCPYYNFIKIRELNRSSCEFADSCEQAVCDCRVSIVECKYMGYVDKDEDSLLWDQCKECGVKNG